MIPARMASSRLPNKPLADIHGLPMVIRVAQQAMKSHARACVVATDHPDIAAACVQHGIGHIMTDAHHPSGSDRLAQACELLGLSPDDMVVNVQGDEPLIDPFLINAVALELHQNPLCVAATAAHPLTDAHELQNPNVVKVVTNRLGHALYFSRSAIPFWRDGLPRDETPPALRHIGLYAYRVGFLQRFPQLEMAPLERAESLEQLRILWHGERIATHIAPQAPMGGVDTQEDLERVRQIIAGRHAMLDGANH
jgi:3-deoxy-manno-octulosonate cytidylyltransferase (CMP-KDO synthetase)